MQRNISKDLFEKAQNFIPGGVNSPVRAFRSVGMEPPFIEKALGSKIVDVDGNEYIDFIGSWGPMILGHANKDVIEAVSQALQKGTSYGAPTAREVELAELICDCVPSIDMLRLVNSGTEAVMSAIRLARGYTKRDKIIKFEGCYHGHSDGLLVKAGSGLLTTGVADSSGVPEGFAKNTICAQYNDINSVLEAFNQHKGEIATIIVEPVAANMGVVPQKDGFLKGLREACDREGALLIFDEVITGFRLQIDGAQGLYGIKPDLSVYGKIIGGGLPIGAYGGRREIMKMISPLGPVYQAGTLSGNPLVTAAGYCTIKTLKDHPEIYERINENGRKIEEGLHVAAKENGMPIWINRVGSLLSVFFTNGEEVFDFHSAMKSDVNLFAKYFKKMFERGIYIAPSQFEAWFFSNAHSEEDITKTLREIKAVFLELA